MSTAQPNASSPQEAGAPQISDEALIEAAATALLEAGCHIVGDDHPVDRESHENDARASLRALAAEAVTE